MKLRAFSILLLGCLLVMTTQGLGDSFSRVSQGQEEIKNKFEVTRITSMLAQKEAPFGKTRGAHHMRKLGPGDEETNMDYYSKNGKGSAEEGASQIISGEGKDASQESLGGLRDQKSDIQETMRMGSKQVWKFTRFAMGRDRPTNTNTKCSKDCNNAVVVKASLKRKDDEAAKEISSLIYKDYKGKPSHKPPINNHDPGN